MEVGIDHHDGLTPCETRDLPNPGVNVLMTVH